MANRYGEAALLAVKMELYGKALSPLERWQDAVGKVYPTTPIGQKKRGPREAFLALCEAGLVKGIIPGQFGAVPGMGNRNRDYATEAVRLLKAGEHKTVSQLWSAVGDGAEHGSQIDVVLALWKNGLIL